MASPKTHGKAGKPLQNTRLSWIIKRLNNGEELSMTQLSREWGLTAKTLF